MTSTQTQIEIEVNGERIGLAVGTTVRGLIERQGLGDAAVAVERNREVVPRRAHADTALVAGDVVELVTLVGGG